MDLDSAAYEAYLERMESRLVEIELRMESIFATPLTGIQIKGFWREWR
jgi:hypothetical protein